VSAVGLYEGISSLVLSGFKIGVITALVHWGGKFVKEFQILLYIFSSTSNVWTPRFF
jgi:hypothetical protein